MFEINLVPDVKGKMIQTLKIRNLILFICIVVSAGAIAVVLILLGIKSGQDIAMANQDAQLKEMSTIINSDESLDEFLAVQNQLEGLNTISENKKVASRIFSILDTTLIRGADTVSLSSLSVDLEENTLTMEGQANAGAEPLIDYRVLESFKKGFGLAKFDYGYYVDEEGNELPEFCVSETDASGVALKENDSYYGEWSWQNEGCNISGKDYSSQSQNGKVRIYRTPQYSTWYKKGYMSLNGEISGVLHFESECTSYTGEESGSTVKWVSNNTCLLAPEGLNVVESTNARDESDNLVLRFTANVTIAPEVFLFQNKNMTIIGTSGQNVTDSYLQVGSMFVKKAKDCADDDLTCRAANDDLTEEKESTEEKEGVE